MIPLKIIGRKKLPDLNQEIDLKDIDEPTDEDVLEQLRKELNELKKERNTIPLETKKEEGIKEIQDFNSLTDVKDYLEKIDDDFFNENIETIKEKIIDFYDRVLPEREIGFEISLLNDKDLILEKVNYSLEVYGNLSLNEKKEVEIKDDKYTENTEQEEQKNIKTQDEIKKETESKEKKRDYFLTQDEAIKILSPVSEKKGFRINNKIIRSLDDLNKIVRSLPLVDFDLNILALSKRKNLCEWIEHTIGYKKLAEKLELAEDREEILEIIDEMIKFAKDAQKATRIKENEEIQSRIQNNSYQKEPKILINKEIHKEDHKEDRFEKNNYEVNNKEETSNKKNKFDILNLFSSNNKKETKETSKKSLKESNDNKSESENQKSNVETQGISKILNDLINYGNERFKEEKQTILKELSNYVSDKEIKIFQNAKTKDEFQELLEQYIYSYPFFKEKLKEFQQTEQEEYTEEIVEEEKFKEKLINNNENNELKLHSYKEELKKDFNFNPVEKIQNENDYSKTESNRYKKQKLELPTENNIKKDNNTKTSNLEEDLSKVDNKYNFFEDRNQLKEEIEQIKYESLIDLPPPEYSLDDELSNLIKPEILERNKYVRTQGTATVFAQKEKSKKIIAEKKRPKQNEKIKNKNDFEQGEQKNYSESVLNKLHWENESGDINLSLNKNLKSIEEQILEKELEMLDLKKKMLMQKKQQEEQILRLLQKTLSSQKEVLTEMNENQKIKEEIIETVTNHNLNIEKLKEKIEETTQKEILNSDKEKDQKRNKSDNKIKSFGESKNQIENKEQLQVISKTTGKNKDLITEFAFDKETPKERFIRSSGVSINEEEEQSMFYTLNFESLGKNDRFTILEETIPIRKRWLLSLFQKPNTRVSIKNRIQLDDYKEQTKEENKEVSKADKSKDENIKEQKQESKVKTENKEKRITEQKLKEERDTDKITTSITSEQKENVVSEIAKPQDRLKQLNKEIEKRREIIKKTKQISEKYKKEIESESMSIDQVLSIIEEFLGDESNESSLNEVSNLIAEAKSLIKKRSKKQANDALKRIQDLKKQAKADKSKDENIKEQKQESKVKTENKEKRITEQKYKRKNKKYSKSIKPKTKNYNKRGDGFSEILTEIDKSLSMNDLDNALELIENAKTTIKNN